MSKQMMTLSKSLNSISIFQDDDDETLAHAGLLDPSGLKDEDFLELFDIEEEGPMDDEEMRKLSESEEKAVEDELSRFFDDALEDEPGIEDNAPQPVEKLSEPDIDLDLAMAAATLTAGTGKFNRPETPFSPDPAAQKKNSIKKTHRNLMQPILQPFPLRQSTGPSNASSMKN